MSPPAFSVVIPTWNRVDLVGRAVQSVLAQTCADFELIVVDDGSTDGTADALAQVTDPRLQVHRRDHQGVGSARNTGTELARGDFLAFLDSDDEALPGWLERFLSALHGGSIDIALCGATIVDPDGSEWSLLPPADDPLTPDAVAPQFFPGCYTLNRALFEAVGGFDPLLELGENTELALRLFTYRPQPQLAAVNATLLRRRAPAIRSQTLRAASAERVLRRHASNRASFPRLWASYHAIVGVTSVQEGHSWRGRYHFLCAVRADPRSVEHLTRLGVSLTPGGSHLVWRTGRGLELRGSGQGPLRMLRRHGEEVADQIGARTWHRMAPRKRVALFDGDPRLALVTVNFSTTRFLKLMLCTLGEQSDLWFVQRVVIIDNHSRDGGALFLRELDARVPRVHLIERHRFLSHAAGMRAGMRALYRIERDTPADERAGLILFCDPDIVFRNPHTILDLSAAMVRHDAAFAGEARLPAPSTHPDVQASFFAVRRDILTRRDVEPLVNHGSPAYGMQASLLRAGLPIVDFPSNHGGYVLHRGRTAVAAATAYGVGSYAGVVYRDPHFMGVRDGADIWTDVERSWAPLLDPAAEARLLDHLANRFGVLGRASAPQ